MSDVKSSRRSKAEATRRRILDAAHLEFLDRGYHGATIASIATRAGVAPQTVYFVFHTKAELISAAVDMLVMGEEAAVPQAADWWADMRDEPEPRQALRHFVRGAAALFERASGLSEILRAAALTDDEVRRTHLQHEELRETGFREVVEQLAAKGPLREGLTLATATDILLVAFSDSTYLQLTTERGWSHEATIDWFCDALPSLLLADPS